MWGQWQVARFTGCVHVENYVFCPFRRCRTRELDQSGDRCFDDTMRGHKRVEREHAEPSTALNAVCPYYTVFPLSLPKTGPHDNSWAGWICRQDRTQLNTLEFSIFLGSLHVSSEGDFKVLHLRLFPSFTTIPNDLDRRSGSQRNRPTHRLQTREDYRVIGEAAYHTLSADTLKAHSCEIAAYITLSEPDILSGNGPLYVGHPSRPANSA